MESRDCCKEAAGSQQEPFILVSRASACDWAQQEHLHLWIQAQQEFVTISTFKACPQLFLSVTAAPAAVEQQEDRHLRPEF
jgi:hypothetical protein